MKANKIQTKDRKLLIIILLIMSTTAFGKNLGVISQVYPIQEEDFLQFIQTRLLDMKKEGSLDQLNQNLSEKARLKADRPSPINLPRALINREWDYDPSIRLTQDLVDDSGKIIAPANTTFNPLDRIQLSSILIFYDGDDPEEVQWVKQVTHQFQLENKSTKLILTNGSIKKHLQLFKQAIFFDQQGRLATRFKIQHVPAIVQQKGKLLSIREVKL